jgi:hypothetical protein
MSRVSGQQHIRVPRSQLIVRWSPVVQFSLINFHNNRASPCIMSVSYLYCASSRSSSMLSGFSDQLKHKSS